MKNEPASENKRACRLGALHTNFRTAPVMRAIKKWQFMQLRSKCAFHLEWLFNAKRTPRERRSRALSQGTLHAAEERLSC